MGKPKGLLKDFKPKKKAAKQEPVTADDFLATGVELEEAGEKWRAGDAAKSMRFFMRAIANYDDGLRRHPTAFDLAYNKARVQYDITQHPKLAAQLPAPPAELLTVALQSHRDAIKLDQDNTDALFNSGQVLNSLAEAISDSKHPGEEQLVQASTYLQEAIELFQRCLLLQELKYTEMQEEIEQMMSSAQAEPTEPAPAPSDSTQPHPEDGEQEQWAAVVEPVTKNTLVDTAVAQLDTLTTLCHVLSNNPSAGGVGWVQEYSSGLIQTRLPAYMEGSDRLYEAGLSRAKFIGALNDLLYRGGLVDAQIYQQEIGQAFGPDLDVSKDPEGLCTKADALISLNAAFADLPPTDADALQRTLAVRWQSLSTALDALTAASKLPNAENLPKIHIARGDAEMQRWRLGTAPWNHSLAQQNSSTLLRNAQTYYRGAAALARRDGAVEEERDGVHKEAIAAALEGQKAKIDQLKNTSMQQLVAVAQEMVEDGMVEGGVMGSLIA
ncbi:Tetratricopeptide-like helical [Penicillium chermesinum]|uniref:Tetratricopeptide-like helical n=1 Tax=Penicillium chermesinum TaxID=63820 RepID=A0A9W9P682_9EURO|nr:Tetratricopeptide-like helical [Penicillium chermesinum]KAJ5238713.1 Tetratricopeptide-like helical [Penicillium chermesinum]KAJ6164358.1 Tetratricopeptide-like helical [Penicillium chermesinum]